MQKKSNQNSGITLIALIITIIVMLILVAVTVNTAVNSGLFAHAKDATQGWKNEEERESNLGNSPITIGGKEYTSLYDYLDELNSNNTPDSPEEPGRPEDTLTTDRTGLQVGDYIAYTPDSAGNYMGLGTSENSSENPSGFSAGESRGNPIAGVPQDTTLTWQVMSINEDGTVDIVSSKPIQSFSLMLNGALGYNNGVYLLNDLCKTQYSNSTLGVTARSIDLEDIENKFNSTGITERNMFIDSRSEVQYGTTKLYEGDALYSPVLYDHVEKTTAGESTDYYTNSTTEKNNQKVTLTVQQSYYSYFHVPENYFDDANFYELIFR